MLSILLVCDGSGLLNALVSLQSYVYHTLHDQMVTERSLDEISLDDRCTLNKIKIAAKNMQCNWVIVFVYCNTGHISDNSVKCWGFCLELYTITTYCTSYNLLCHWLFGKLHSLFWFAYSFMAILLYSIWHLQNGQNCQVMLSSTFP